MALKIYEMKPDAAGVVTAAGHLDGEPFSLSAIGRRWLLRLANGLTVEQDAIDVASKRDARGALYAAVARIRESQKMAAV